MRIEIKRGFNALGDTNPSCFWGILVIMGVFDDWGYPMIGTSGNDGKAHGAKSLHYQGLAVDFRCQDPAGEWSIDDDTAGDMVAAVLDRWNSKDYEFIYEPDKFVAGKQTRWAHFHFEHQRKRPEG